MKPDKNTFVQWLSNELLRFCGPIFVAPALNSYPEEMVGNGTYALIDTGKRCLLVTCSHVWDAYETKHDADAETVLAVSLGDGRSNLAFKNPKDHCVALDRDLDLVVVDFEPAHIRVPHNKSWFKLTHWPLPSTSKGDHIVTLGFPGAWRETAGEECLFRCVALPFLVTDVNGRTIAAFSDGRNTQVLDDMKNSLAGLSGSPAYRLDARGELHLIGFAKLGVESAEAPNRKYQTLPDSPLPAILFTHASFLQPDGSLSR